MKKMIVLTALMVAWAGADLRDAAKANGVNIGVALESVLYARDTEYRAAMVREFNAIDIGSLLTWEWSRPGPESFSWFDSDDMVYFGTSNGMLVRGGVLVPQNNLPDWLTQGCRNRETMLEALKTHVYNTVGHYAGEVGEWDITDGAFEYSETEQRVKMKTSIWSETIGEDFLDSAFVWAKAADPDSRLFYSGRGLSDTNPVACFVFNWIKERRTAGIPVDGISVRFDLAEPRDESRLESIRNTLEQYREEGLKTVIANMEVRTGSSNGLNLSPLFNYYADIAGLFVNQPGGTAIILSPVLDNREPVAREKWLPLLDEGFIPNRPYFMITNLLEYEVDIAEHSSPIAPMAINPLLTYNLLGQKLK